jgi:hypothetical protein
MSEARSYTGGCHCGAVRYDVITDLRQVISCNCSICRKKGAILTFAPTSAFTLKSGEDSLQDYQFNRRVIHHLFCRTCGVESFARGIAPDGTETVAVNIRCLDGVDLEAVKPIPFNGLAL